MKVLSFDCADKTLGVALLEYDEEWKVKLEPYNKPLPSKIKKSEALAYVDGIAPLLKPIRIKGWWVVDLVPEGKSSDASLEVKLARLKYFLSSIPSADLIIVEYQMGLNTKSRNIMSGIIEYYTNPDPNIVVTGSSDITGGSCSPKNVVVVGTGLKNSHSFADHLDYSHFAAKYKTSYAANKNHCLSNMLYWMELWEPDQLPLFKSLKKKDDVAEAMMQAIVFLLSI
jgi:hypothetical protein